MKQDTRSVGKLHNYLCNMETNTSQPDWQAREAQAALHRPNPNWPLTKREQVARDYEDEIREERAICKEERRVNRECN